MIKSNYLEMFFLLTDGEINDKKDTLDLIYKNSSKYSIYSIGIGQSFDEDLIKNAGIIGKGNYYFCEDIEGINSTIVKAIKNSIKPYYENINIKSSLDNENLIKNNSIPEIIRDNKIINLNYIIKNENNNNNNKINFEINYLFNNEKIDKKYEIASLQLLDGEELSKLIINNYLNNSNLDDEEKIKLALKYQIFTKNTSLFAEIELSDKISKEMKEEIIGNKENNKIEIKKTSFIEYDEEEGRQNPIFRIMQDHTQSDEMIQNPMINNSMMQMAINPMMQSQMMQSQMMQNQMNQMMQNQMMQSQMMQNQMMQMMQNQMMQSQMMQNQMMKNQMMGMKRMDNSKMNNMNIAQRSKTLNLYESNNIKKDNELKKLDLNEKDDIMKIINSQDFIDGFWEINELTEIVKEKYKKEYDLLKGIKNNKIMINDKVAITILIIYFINKEHAELLDELLMIIAKAKIFISNEAKESYENIIKEIGIN